MDYNFILQGTHIVDWRALGRNYCIERGCGIHIYTQYMDSSILPYNTLTIGSYQSQLIGLDGSLI